MIASFGLIPFNFWFNAAFKEMYNTGKGGLESAEDITPVAMKWLGENVKKDNWFLHINYWDPHTPYRAPAEFGNPFEKDPPPDWLTPAILEKHLAQAGPHTANEISMYDDKTDPRYPRQPGSVKDIDGFKRLIDGYDCGIRYMDNHIGKILDCLKENGVYEDTAIIISSDHGENFGELGVYAEHGTSDDITHRIPMIIKWPGMKQGHADKGLHYNLDLPATLLDLFGKEQNPRLDGQSYADTLRYGKECGRKYLVLGQCCHVCQRSVRFEDWIYIRTWHDGYRMQPAEMLFDLKRDPHETENLAPKKRVICARAADYMEEWRRDAMKRSPVKKDPMKTVLEEGGPAHAKKGMLEKYLVRLKETGRSKQAAELARKHKI